jgi:hypothetical protein
VSCLEKNVAHRVAIRANINLVLKFKVFRRKFVDRRCLLPDTQISCFSCSTKVVIVTYFNPTKFSVFSFDLVRVAVGRLGQSERKLYDCRYSRQRRQRQPAGV